MHWPRVNLCPQNRAGAAADHRESSCHFMGVATPPVTTRMYCVAVSDYLEKQYIYIVYMREKNIIERYCAFKVMYMVNAWKNTEIKH